MDTIVQSPLQPSVPNSYLPPQDRKGRGRDKDFIYYLTNRCGELALFDETHPFNKDPEFSPLKLFSVLWPRKERIQAIFEQIKRKWALERFAATRETTEADKDKMLGLVGSIPEDSGIPQAVNIREYVTYETEW